MHKLIGISGTHGTGKSTVLSALVSKGYNVIDRSLAREAQAALGANALSEFGKSFDSAMDLQAEILTQLGIRDSEILAGDTSCFVERTPLDLWAYTVMWCHIHKKPQSRLEIQLYKEVLQLKTFNYDTIFILHPHNDIPFQPDPNRADLAYRGMVERIIDELADDRRLVTHIHHIVSSSVEDRVNEIIGALK